MNSKYLVIAGWIIIPAITFALGWALKPTPEAPPSGDTTTSTSSGDSGSVPVSTRTSSTKEGATPGARVTAMGIGTTESRELKRGDIERLGRQFKESLDPIERRFAFAQLLDGMTLENAKTIREQIAHLPAHSAEFRDFHYAWGKIGGVEAIMNGAETEKPDMATTLAGWASADPAKALAWFEELDKTPGDDEENRNFANKEYLKWGMVHGLSDSDPKMAAEFVFSLSENGEKGAEHMLGTVTGKLLKALGTVEAAAWAESLPEGKLRESAMGRVAHTYAREDPEAAARWAEPMIAGESGGRVVGAISREWAARDGAAAVQWIESLENSPGHAYHAAFEGWARKDPTAASQYIVDMPESDNRDSAIGGLVSRHRWEDPVAALTWADQISNEERRLSTLITAAQAYYRKDRKAASEWLPNSGLSEEAQKKIRGGGGGYHYRRDR